MVQGSLHLCLLWTGDLLLGDRFTIHAWWQWLQDSLYVVTHQYLHLANSGIVKWHSKVTLYFLESCKWQNVCYTLRVKPHLSIHQQYIGYQAGSKVSWHNIGWLLTYYIVKITIVIAVFLNILIAFIIHWLGSAFNHQLLLHLGTHLSNGIEFVFQAHWSIFLHFTSSGNFRHPK